MPVQDWLRNWLGVIDIENKLVSLEQRISAIEEQVSCTLKHFGNYKNRTKEELVLMRSQLQTLLDSIKNIIESVDNQQHQIRALKLRARLLNNLNRINKHPQTELES
jgi:hypothetical protein